MARKEIDFLAHQRFFALLSTAAVLVSIVLLFVPGPKYGIDFAGGTNIIARFSEAIDDSELREVVETIGFEDASVVRFGAGDDNQYLIQTGAVSSITPEAAETLGTAVQTEFGNDAAVEFDEATGDRIYVVIPEEVYGERQEQSADELSIARYTNLQDDISARLESALSGAGFTNTHASIIGNPSARRYAVNIQTLQSVVDELFREVFAERFVEIDRVETVGPRVGQQLRADAAQAIFFALIGILLYLAFRFDLRYAPAAVLALLHDVLITLGIFVVLREEINLPILAAMLTIVGYSLNDTIVNFDRIRENLQLSGPGADLDRLVNRSVNECFSRTILTSATTLFAVLAIYFLGGGLIKSFALAMIIGVLIGTYSSLYISNPAMIWIAKTMAANARTPVASTTIA